MGNGGSIKYKKQKEDAPDAWRKPKETKKSKEKEKEEAAKAPAPAPSVGQDVRRGSKPKDLEVDTGTSAPSASPSVRRSSSMSQSAAAALSAEKAATSWHAPTPLSSEGKRAPPPVSSAFEDEDDDDLDGFGDLADAAAKVWEDLMSQKHESKKDFASLFHLGELKDGVERANKRAESINHKASAAGRFADEKTRLLEEASLRMEERGGRPVDGLVWKLGDIGIRRNKGLCEISMVHHEADPPYFEVRMLASSIVVGTEYSKLLALTAPEQGVMRRAVRAMDEAKTAATRAEKEANQANDELKQQHDSLTAQVEKALKQAQESAPQSAMSSGLGGPKLAPMGMPDLDQVRKWSGAPREIIPDLPAPTPTPAPAVSSSCYPDARDVREDNPMADKYRSMSVKELKSELGTRGISWADAVDKEELVERLLASQASPASSPTDNYQSGSPAGAGSGAAAGRQAPFQPSGFPSFDAMKQSQQQRQAKPAQQQGSDYPSVHPSAARESFGRPTETPSRGASKTAKDESFSSRADSKSGLGSSFKGQSAPTGFPSMPSGFPSFEASMGGVEAKSQPESAFRPPGASGPSLGKKASSSAAQAAQAQREAQAAADALAAAAAAQQQAEQQAWQQQQPQQQAPRADVWVCYASPQGAPYYHNERTNETVWVLPAGAAARNPDGTPVATQSWSEQADSDDPFANLRKQEEKMAQEREYWSQWYAQNAQQTTYPQAGQQAKEPASSGSSSKKPKAASASGGGQAGQGTGAAGPAGPGYNPFYDESEAPPPVSAAPSRGPPPPRLLAGVEDHTVYAIKSAILKEMEQMVDQAKPAAVRKKALRCLQIRWHPDKNPDKLEISNTVFQFIEETKPWFLFDPDAQD